MNDVILAMPSNIRRILYLNIASGVPPRDAPYIRGLRMLGIGVDELRDSSPGLRKYYRLWRDVHARARSYDLIWIGYSAHTLPSFICLATKRRIVFNALGPLYEGIVVSRGRRNVSNLFGALPWLIDFIGFRCADKVLVETDAQAHYCSNLLKLPISKFVRAWTGADESIFHPNPSVRKLPKFTVLFRGAFLPEAGIMVLAETARILRDEPIAFRVIGDGMMADEFTEYIAKHKLTNIEWIRKRLSNDELRIAMLECHLSLGQLSDHPRLQRTIPHKAFESLALALPYLTARTPAMMELLRENETCIAVPGGRAEELAHTLRELRQEPRRLEDIARAGAALYTTKLTAERLTVSLLSRI